MTHRVQAGLTLLLGAGLGASLSRLWRDRVTEEGDQEAGLLGRVPVVPVVPVPRVQASELTVSGVKHV